jgi:hypothetical protein
MADIAANMYMYSLKCWSTVVLLQGEDSITQASMDNAANTRMLREVRKMYYSLWLATSVIAVGFMRYLVVNKYSTLETCSDF